MIGNLASILGITLSEPIVIVLASACSSLAICLCYKLVDFLTAMVGSFFRSDTIKF